MRCTLLCVSLLSLVACGGPTFTRGSDDASIDEAALSTKLDRADLNQALDSWAETFQASPFYLEVSKASRKIAVLGIENNSSEHIGSALQILTDGVETRLVNSGIFDVISRDTLVADAIMEERLRTLGDNVDPETVAALGKEFGIHYFVHGKVSDISEKTGDRRRVQYGMFLKVTEVATSRRVFQLEVPLTKQLDG
jgi:hypothetical protein